MNIDTGTPNLLAEVDGAIGWITFNNPERRNAVSIAMWQGLSLAIAALEADPAVRVVVLKGAGGKAFVAGADISQFETERANATANETFSARSSAATRALTNLAKPTITMINGFCIGGGLAIALCTDIRICEPGSRFGIPAARLGLGYRFDGVRALMNIVGPSLAKEILFTARHFSADEALRIGLVNRVVDAGDLESVVRDYARMIAENAPMTVAAAKLAVNEAVKDPAARDVAAVDAAVAACFQSDDFTEGRTAFMEKRRPVFKGC